ncbi:MAG: response regulator [Bacteroidota bacterium]|nr:response regulator [Bacteroidota bacterium]
MTKPALLFVDDSEDMLEFLESEFSDKYEVFTAMNGIQALDILKKQAIQLVVSDVMMPEMDGFELCKQIKTQLDYSHIPVILLTARNTLQSKIEGLEIGADAYIEKPFSTDFLHVQITNLLENRNKIKIYYASSPLAHIKSMANSRADETFLENIEYHILQNLEDQELDVESLAKITNMSKATLYRKIKSIANLSPNELINITRLKKAAELLATGNYKIYEVAEMAGFSSQSNFGRSFLKQFGMTASDYMHSKTGKRE